MEKHACLDYGNIRGVRFFPVCAIDVGTRLFEVAHLEVNERKREVRGGAELGLLLGAAQVRNGFSGFSLPRAQAW